MAAVAAVPGSALDGPGSVLGGSLPSLGLPMLFSLTPLQSDSLTPWSR